MGISRGLGEPGGILLLSPGKVRAVSAKGEVENGNQKGGVPSPINKSTIRIMVYGKYYLHFADSRLI